MTARLYIPRASLSERIARQAVRLALGMVAATIAGACISAFALGVGCLSLIR